MNRYLCINEYKKVLDPDKWGNCPVCGLKPKVWEFDNGRSTACGCGENQYNHFSIRATPIMKSIEKTGGFANYDPNELKDNWNKWVRDYTKESN